GLPVEHGPHMILADEPERFAGEVAALLHDPERQRILGQNARDLVERNHSWEQVGRVFSDICIRAAEKSRSRKEHSS
ncbi:MAG: glycosyltransferase, partial [Armatimonadetes bacterium]|nr:glycosyltransferase [Armatimonadota bacterium]